MKFLKQLLKKWNVTETHGPPIGIYNVAGGNVGIGKALEAHNLLGKTVFIGHEINPNSRMLLESDHMDNRDQPRRGTRSGIKHRLPPCASQRTTATRRHPDKSTCLHQVQLHLRRFGVLGRK